MKMQLEDAVAVLDLCWRVRQRIPEAERITLTVALINRFGKLSEPMLFAAEDAVFYGLCGEERPGAIPLKDLPRLVSLDDEIYISQSQG